MLEIIAIAMSMSIIVTTLVTIIYRYFQSVINIPQLLFAGRSGE